MKAKFVGVKESGDAGAGLDCFDLSRNEKERASFRVARCGNFVHFICDFCCESGTPNISRILFLPLTVRMQISFDLQALDMMHSRAYLSGDHDRS